MVQRLGISTLVIENKDELEEILSTISQKSRGNTIYVTGSHEKGSSVAQNLGISLAKNKKITLVSGQSSGIGSDAVSAFTEQCIKDRYDINTRIQIFPNPYAANANFSNDPSLLPDLKKCRSKLMNSTQIVIAFSGGMGTEAEIEVAKNRNCKMLPVVLNDSDLDNNAIKKILDDPTMSGYLKQTDTVYYEKLLQGTVSVEDIMGCVNKMLGWEV